MTCSCVSSSKVDIPIGTMTFLGINPVINLFELIAQTHRRPRNAVLLCTAKVRTWKYLANSTTVFQRCLVKFLSPV